MTPSGDRLGVKVGTTVNWFLPDLHGDIAASLSQDEATVVNAVRYDAYGQTITTGTAGGTRVGDKAWKYQGRLDISPDGLGTPLYDMSARFYNPGLGAFTQLDTVMGKAQDPMSMNRFLYASANPTTLTDPTGHCPFCILLIPIAIGFFAGAGTDAVVQQVTTGTVDWGQAAVSGAIGSVHGRRRRRRRRRRQVGRPPGGQTHRPTAHDKCRQRCREHRHRAGNHLGGLSRGADAQPGRGCRDQYRHVGRDGPYARGRQAPSRQGRQVRTAARCIPRRRPHSSEAVIVSPDCRNSDPCSPTSRSQQSHNIQGIHDRNGSPPSDRARRADGSRCNSRSNNHAAHQRDHGQKGPPVPGRQVRHHQT